MINRGPQLGAFSIAQEVPMQLHFQSHGAIVAAIQFDSIPVTVVPVQFNSSRGAVAGLELSRFGFWLDCSGPIRFDFAAVPHLMPSSATDLNCSAQFSSAGFQCVVSGFDLIQLDSNRGRTGYESCLIPSHGHSDPYSILVVHGHGGSRICDPSSGAVACNCVAPPPLEHCRYR